MDGISSTPSGAPSDAPQPTTVCPACGTTVPQARFCGACGASLAESGPGPALVDQAAMPTTPAQPVQPAQREHAAVVAGPGKTCSWCGAVSPPDAKNCSSCDAAFPTPEGDEALERAARERIEEMQAEINKSRGSTWWPFRPR